MFSDAKRYVERKFRKIEFIHTKLPDGYKEIEAEYRSLRDTIKLLYSTIDSLSTYEFGGSYFKKLGDLSNKFTEATNIPSFHSNDMFTNVSITGRSLAETSTNPATQETCRIFADAYMEIARLKREMNDKLEKVRVDLDGVKETSKEIDKIRNKVNDVRYDLEELKQEGVSDENKIEVYEKNFRDISDAAKTKMTSFLQESVGSIVEDIASAEFAFYEEATNELKLVTK